MVKSPDVIVKEISEIICDADGENFRDLCSSINCFVDEIDVKNPKLSLNQYEMILENISELIQISYILNMNYKPYVESNPENNVNGIYNKTIAAISSKLSEIEKSYDEYYNSFYDENSGGDA